MIILKAILLKKAKFNSLLMLVIACGIPAICVKGNDKTRDNKIFSLFPVSLLFGFFRGRLLIDEGIEDSFFGGVKKEVKPIRISEEIRPDSFINGEYHMAVIDIESGL